ncbi:Gfo/Idh/MocA family protein [Streptomyces sp. NPDC057702]|uniref:Gfo/Idh/MocA family protein n=1 Tax=unclassified Streptomyces TaxID=2593676 RepID=UPI00369EBB3C
MKDVLGIGLVGAGNISEEYVRTLHSTANVRPVQVASRTAARAQALADRFPGLRATTLSELYESSEVDLVLDLTLPQAHFSVSEAAIAAGKHLYGEKPLAVTTEEARLILDAARKAGVRVGCAPDTVLGTGIQTARRCLDAGDIGVPVAASAFMFTPGHERWHPDPEFYYRSGGGPLLDMGPYYLTALVSLLGPIVRVVGMSATPRAQRTIGAGPRAGTVFGVEVATHVTGVLEHEGGVLSTIIMSFDVWHSTLPRIEIYGTGGSLLVPDPNSFAGDVSISRAGSGSWDVVPVSGGYRGAARGVGVADMARAITGNVPHRANGEIAYHVLDVMECLLASARTQSAQVVGSRCERPAVVPLGARPARD